MTSKLNDAVSKEQIEEVIRYIEIYKYIQELLSKRPELNAIYLKAKQSNEMSHEEFMALDEIKFKRPQSIINEFTSCNKDEVDSYRKALEEQGFQIDKIDKKDNKKVIIYYNYNKKQFKQFTDIEREFVLCSKIGNIERYKRILNSGVEAFCTVEYKDLLRPMYGRLVWQMLAFSLLVLSGATLYLTFWILGASAFSFLSLLLFFVTCFLFSKTWGLYKRSIKKKMYENMALASPYPLHNMPSDTDLFICPECKGKGGESRSEVIRSHSTSYNTLNDMSIGWHHETISRYDYGDVYYPCNCCHGSGYFTGQQKQFRELNIYLSEFNSKIDEINYQVPSVNAIIEKRNLKIKEWNESRRMILK